jgi:mxaJ protein
MFSSCRSFLAIVCSGVLVLAARAEAPRVLRVAADPNNLPFSNDRGEGFENRLAELVARDLGARVEYIWWPQRRGFFRETLGAGRADVVMGVPAGFDRVLTTRPYYQSTYVFVQKFTDRPVHSFDDARLAKMKIGVQLAGDDGANPPPAKALTDRGLIENIRGYTLYGNYGEPAPPSAIIRAVETGEIDTAVAWGPMAGYFAARQREPLVIEPVDECHCPGLPMIFAIAVGVRRGETALQQEIDAILERRRAEIAMLLAEFNVPVVARAPVAQGPDGPNRGPAHPEQEHSVHVAQQ